MVNFIFIGKMSSGKTYYAELLKEKLEKLGIKTYKLSTATKLKEIATDLFGMKEKDRRLLQQLGAGMRQIKSTVWIDYLINKIEKENLQPFIIDDVRFMNEYNEYSKFGIIVVKISNESDEQRLQVYEKLYGRRPTKKEMNDSTETEFEKIPYSYSFENDYRPETAIIQIDMMLQNLGIID
jgi:dephospho-CoA kinase